MLEFEKTDEGCLICGRKNTWFTEKMKIMRDIGDNVISFSICEKCRKVMLNELEAHED